MATSSSFSLKDAATTGVAVAASLAALYSVLSLSVHHDLTQDERVRRQAQTQAQSQYQKSNRRRRKTKSSAIDQSVGPDCMGAVPGDSAFLHSSTTAIAIPTVPPPSMVSTLPPPTSSGLHLDDSSMAIASADDPLRLSQLDQPTLDSELARTDAKLRRLLKRKEKLELRRNQLSVHQMRVSPPISVDEHPSIVPSVTLPSSSSGLQIRPLTADERVLFGLPPVGAGVPMPPSVEGQEEGRNSRDSVSISTVTSTGLTTYSAGARDGTAAAAAMLHVPLGVSSVSSEHNELDAAAAASSSSSSSAADADVPVEDDEGPEEEDEDDDSDVLSSISDASAGMESVISDTSLGSDFSFLSDARYGLFHQHG